MIKKIVEDIYHNPTPGDLCMDAPFRNDWEALQDLAKDKIGWRKRVEKIKASTAMPKYKIKTPTRRSNRQRISPLKRKARQRFRTQQFARTRDILGRKLRQTDIREYFASAKTNTTLTIKGKAKAFLKAAQKSKTNATYSFEPAKAKAKSKPKKRKKKKKKSVSNSAARRAYYHKLNHHKLFLGCKIPTPPTTPIPTAPTTTKQPKRTAP